MGVATVPLSSVAGRIVAVLAGCTLLTEAAMAFPATDAENPSFVANGPQPTQADLRHQLQTQGGFAAAPAGGGWTFTPQLGAEEYFTDNVLQTPTNRRWDLVTLVTPGISVAGDLPNAQVQFTYAPQFRLDATTPQENGISQQLAGTAEFTIVPDAFYVDVRALAGAAPAFGGFNAFGSGLTPQSPQIGLGLGSQGLAKQNETQNSSFSITPYYLHRFGDIGTAKIGYELNVSTIAPGGTAFPMFIAPGPNTQKSVTNEVVAQFQTGEAFAPYRDLLIASAMTGNGNGVSNNEHDYSVTNQLGYAINRNVSVYGQLGYEDLQFGGIPPVSINDVTWGFGTVWSPNPDSQITLGYGHQQGTTGVQFSGYYAITARTRISARYSTGVQTNLDQLQGQLDLTAFNQNGEAVDSQTGAPLFNGFNGLGAQTGLFRGKTFEVSVSTSLDRDQFNLSGFWSQNTTIAVANTTANTVFNPLTPSLGSTSQGFTAYASWIHQINDSLSLDASASYGVSSVSGGTTVVGTGQLTSIGAGIGMQYQLSQTLTTFVRYNYFAQLSPQANQSIYQDLFLVGFNKQF